MLGTVIYFDLGNTLVFGPANNKEPFTDALEIWNALFRRYPG